MAFSESIVYVDESGDHGLASVDPSYPVFVLAFCVFDKQSYTAECVPALQALKFEYFGHDMVVLHEREIRKATGPFQILIDPQRRREFHEDLTRLMARAPFTLIASAIHKRRLQESYETAENPYDLALKFCMERLLYHLRRRGNAELPVHLVFESRGKKEDGQLELAFRRVCDGGGYGRDRMPFEAVFAPKSANCSGLQLADLVARPIGRHILQPDQPNRAYEVIRNKFRRSPGGKIEGWGLKVFPRMEPETSP